MLDTGAIINVNISPPHHTSWCPHHAQLTMFLTGTPHRRLGLCPGGGWAVWTGTEHVAGMLCGNVEAVEGKCGDLCNSDTLTPA